MSDRLLAALRAQMESCGVDAYIAPNSDFHASEYIGEAFKTVRFLTGFTGTTATLVVLPDRAALWTDEGYFLQAKQELSGSGITLFHTGHPDSPTVAAYLKEGMPADGLLAGDGRTLTARQALELLDSLGGQARFLDRDLAGELWKDRPPLPNAPVWVLSERYAGEPAEKKLAWLREQVAARADAHLIATLDDIAWLLNLRGGDIAYNPVALAYLAVLPDRALLFIDPAKLDAQVRAHLDRLGVEVLPYEAAQETVEQVLSGKRVLLMPERVGYAFYLRLEAAKAQIIEGENPSILRKSVKNAVQLEHLRQAHQKDGVAVTKLLCWLKTGMEGGHPTEAQIAEKLDTLRLGQEGCLGPSFITISGFGAHGAIVHYHVTPESDVPVEPDGLLLLDSGGQYLEGTTDLTRTVVIGSATAEQKRCFTLVLQGMLNLSAAVFPIGVCGRHLDVLARGPLWSNGLDYGHGTGHGIGSLLCVHEPPIGFNWRITARNDTAPFAPGMVVSDEPGVYLPGRFGVRLENQLACREAETDGFLRFETLTLAPIDLDAVDPSLLDARGREQLNAYHKRVYEQIGPFLTEEEQHWLREATRPI